MTEAEPGGRGSVWVWWAGLLAAVAAARWVLLPRYLITFDEINFALSIDDFDPNKHQPQPPGYPLFVGLLKLLARAIGDVETLFFAAGMLVSAAALVMLWWLAGLMGGPRQRWMAPLLLAFHPAFWLSALTNPVRLTEAAGAAAVAVCAWQAYRRRSARWLWLGALGVGLAAGFRPTLAVLLAPLLAWATWKMRARWADAAVAVACGAVGVAVWLPVLIQSSGGWAVYEYTLRHYSEGEFSRSSLLFGAPAGAAALMAWRAVLWSGMGVLTWVWCWPWARRHAATEVARGAWQMLAVWYFAGLLFYALFHVADPDHTLSIVPATCLAGAFVVGRFTQGAGPWRRGAVMTLCVALNAVLFLKPISREARASTHVPVQWLEGRIAEVLDDVRALREQGPVTVIFDEPATGWRQLSYYEPEAQLLVLVRGAAGEVVQRHIRDRKIVQSATAEDGVVELPACEAVAFVDAEAGPVSKRAGALQPVHLQVFVGHPAPGEEYAFRGYRLRATAGNCGGE